MGPDAPVAQRIEHRTSDPAVGGSSPSRRATHSETTHGTSATRWGLLARRARGPAPEPAGGRSPPLTHPPPAATTTCRCLSARSSPSRRATHSETTHGTSATRWGLLARRARGPAPEPAGGRSPPLTHPPPAATTTCRCLSARSSPSRRATHSETTHGTSATRWGLLARRARGGGRSPPLISVKGTNPLHTCCHPDRGSEATERRDLGGGSWNGVAWSPHPGPSARCARSG